LIFEALNVTAQQAAEKVIYFVIPSGARNLSSTLVREKKERFLAPLGMTKCFWGFFRGLRSRDLQRIFMRLLHLKFQI
jgi:hypothetical protein